MDRLLRRRASEADSSCRRRVDRRRGCAWISVWCQLGARRSHRVCVRCGLVSASGSGGGRKCRTADERGIRAAAGSAAGWTDLLFEAAEHIHAYDRQNGTITKLLPGTTLCERTHDLQPWNGSARGAVQHEGFVDGSGNSGGRKRSGGVTRQWRRSPLRHLAERIASLRAGRGRVRISHRRRERS
jgi:hypothetical protein